MYGSQAYGTLPGPLKPQEAKVTLPFQAVFLSWFLPTVVFTVVSGAASSSLLTYYPFLIYGLLALVVLGCLLTLHIVSLVLRRYFSGKSKVFPFWYAFLGAALTVSLIASMWFAHLNYMKNEIVSDTLKRLATATDVDPAVDSSSRYLDVGRVIFTPGSSLDLRRSVGFKNKEVYCVAPIVSNTSKAPASYDYWAVGLNCCDANGFHCGEYQKPNARSGVRLLNEEQREFYTLAVHEAEANYGIKSSLPLFFFWVEDATALQRSWEFKTLQYWLVAVLTFSAFLFATTVAGVAFFEAFLATW